MSRYLRILVLAALGILGASCSVEGDGRMAPVASTAEELLRLSDGFAVMQFGGFRQTTLEDLGADKGADDCRYVADIVQEAGRVTSWSFGDTAGSLLSACDRCFGEEESTCVMEEWHYLIPEDAQTEYAVFFRNNTNPDWPDTLVALFEIVDGQVDMTPLPDGELVAVEDMEAYLQAFNTDPDNRSFLP